MIGEINHAQLNLLDSHDTARALWILDEDESALRLCALFQMTMPGAPCIYYGDEIGLAAGDDPDCRGAFPWNQQERWNQGLLEFYRQITAMRHKYPVLRTGTFTPLFARDRLYAFRRQLEQKQAIVFFNTDTRIISQTLALQKKVEVRDILQVWPRTANRLYQVRGQSLELMLPAREAVVLMCDAGVM